MRFFCLMLFASVVLLACHRYEVPPRVLVFTKTEGFRHNSIPAGIVAFQKLCTQHGVMMDTTELASRFTEQNLRRYAAVVFLNTTGDVLDPVQENAFERYIQAGGGFMGVHSATDTEYKWTWFGGLVGGYFNGHPPGTHQATLQVKDHSHESTRHLGSDWARTDEWYNLRDVNPNVKVLLNIDEQTYKGGDMGQNHPMAWYHEYDGGRAFYTAGGHTLESYEEPAFLQHLLGGLRYAIGNNKPLRYDRCRTAAVPDPTRFVKTVFASNLNEPMKFDMFPDGRIILVERRGNIKLFDPTTGELNIVYKLPVLSALEDGLLGVAISPDWEKTHWIYLMYSPLGDETVNQVSRFVFRGDSLDRASEKVIIKVKVQRQECCHAAGCIDFDEQGNLFISTGDNTNPFASEGYAPIDERPGRSAWDARRSSANTKDLRGKILRITPHPDGSYTCPADNLFAKDTTKGRPEIYVMGCRNPFRFSWDGRRKLLFWGEVGPDAGEPDTARGPAGHDEVNRAKAAGFFGWPLFVGDNKPYRAFSFTTRKNGPPFDPKHPINNSPNNTGAQALPPAQPAFIWYPYGNSPDFPLTGNGGRNAMAGPTYYCDRYPANTRFPDYYDGKVIIYEWMRNWMMAVTVDSLGNFSRMEPFADSLRFSRPTDMMIDKNGSIWVLEYGTQWFSANPDARLSRIDYFRGNRPPIPVLQTDKPAGAAPLACCFSLSQTKDYDGDYLRYRLDFGDNTPSWSFDGPRSHTALSAVGGMATVRNRLDSIRHVFSKPGTYTVTLTVEDEKGVQRKTTQNIAVGNEPPTVHWALDGHNRSFYEPGDTLRYRLVVEDREDGSLATGSIPSDAIAATIDHLTGGFDLTSIAQGHQAAMQNLEYAKGKLLVERADCKTCHAIDRKINGPAYVSISERYRNNEFAVRNLANKVIKGGAGVWGETVMSAHPQVSEEDASEMVRWILSVGSQSKPKQSVALQGRYPLIPPPTEDKKPVKDPGTFILQASYRDRGAGSQQRIENGEVIALRPAFLQAERADSLSRKVRTYQPFGGDTVVLNDLRHRDFFVVKHADLAHIHGVSVCVGSGDKRYRFAGGRLELRLGAPDGPLLGQTVIPERNNPNRMEFQVLSLNLDNPPTDGRFHDLYFVAKNEQKPSQGVAAVDWVRFNFLK